MEIKVRIAEEKDVERVAMLYEKLHDFLETHENHPRWIRYMWLKWMEKWLEVLFIFMNRGKFITK